MLLRIALRRIGIRRTDGKEVFSIRRLGLKGNLCRSISAKRRPLHRHDDAITVPRKIPALCLHGIILPRIVRVPREIVLRDKERRQDRPNICNSIRSTFSEPHLLERAVRRHEHAAVFVRGIHDIRA